MSVIGIVGAGGYVGTSLIESLVLDGVRDVRAIVRAYRSVASLARFGSAIELRIADADDAESLTSALDGVSTVVNLTTGPPASIVRSTAAIHASARAAGAERLIHLSSAVVFGAVTSASTDDDSLPDSRHWMPYARAKSAAEAFLRCHISATGPRVTVLRPGIVWGVRSPHTMQIVRMLLEKTAYLVGDGSGIFNGIYIDNLVACIRACCSPVPDGAGFFNVADDERVTWREFFSAFAARLEYDMARIPRVSRSRCPISKGLVLDWLLSLPSVNGLYHRSKRHLPDAVKVSLKRLLAGPYAYGGVASAYATNPGVDRELWHLQRVEHKLPHAKFAARFGPARRVSFEEGVRRTFEWLRFMGYARVG